jgi:hypothetical protein
MNKDTQFLLERIDSHHKEIMEEIKIISAKQNKFAGAFTVITALVSASVSAMVAFLTGR